jgi:hypothetical protein
MQGRFQPGDHLHVRRRLGYYHHGIYISDDRVIQFGCGVTLQNKVVMAMDAVSLAEFEDSGTAEMVRHGYESWFTGHHPSADQSWKIVARAEFLLKLQSRLLYNLVGHNCEIIANMCASGSWTESYQVRRWFGRKAAADAVLLFWLAARSRTERSLPRAANVAIVASVAVGMAAIGTYNSQIGKFWREIRGDWEAHERMLDGDPRNGAAA